MPARSKVGDILLKAKVIDELQLRAALARHEQWGGRLAKIVCELGFATEDRICNAIAAGMQVDRVQVGMAHDAGALAKLDERFCESHAVFPVQLKDNGHTLVLAMADPSDLDTADHASSLAHCRVVTVIAAETEISSAISRCYRGEARHVHKPPEHPMLRADERELDLDGPAAPTDPVGRPPVLQAHPTPVPARATPVPARATPVPARATPVPARATPLPAGPTHAPARDILDEILSGLPPSHVLTREEQARLEALRTNHEKSAKILRAVIELLAEKGYATPQELAARLKS